MKNLILLLFVLFLFVGTASAGVDQFVTNGGFETGDLTGWGTPNGSEYDISVTSLTSHSGQYACRLETDVSGYDSHIYQEVNLTNRDTLRFYFRLLDVGEASGSGLRVLINSSGGSSSQVYYWPTTTESDWREVTLDVSGYTGDTYIGIFTANPGTRAIIDDVEVLGEKPILISPSNGYVENVTYPPLLHEIDLIWDESTFSSTYRYQVAADISFNQIVEDDYTVYTEETVSLTAGTYYWRVYPYDTTTEELGTVSDTYSFTISETGGDGEGTAINGVVYEMVDGDPAPLQNAIVNIYNGTYSDQVTTGSNGFYLFEGLDSTSTYSIQATKTDYEDSEIQLVTPSDGETTTKNILMQKRTDESQYYSPHYVEFTLKSFNGMVYDGVQVNVFKGDAATPTFTGTTGADGGVSFKLDQNQQYTLELYSDEHDIDTKYTVTPRDTHYNIYVSLWDEPTREENNVKFFLTQQEINLYAGYINATWNDTSGLTTNVTMFINDTNETNLYTLTSTNSTGNFSQEVDNNATYLVKFILESGGLTETFERTGVITFNAGVNDAFDLGFSEQWHYSLIGALIITLIATFFGVANAHAGAFVVSLGGWFMLFIGWFVTDPVTVAMLVLVTLLSVGFYLRKGEDVT